MKVLQMLIVDQEFLDKLYAVMGQKASDIEVLDRVVITIERGHIHIEEKKFVVTSN